METQRNALKMAISAMRGLYGGWRCTNAIKTCENALAALDQEQAQSDWLRVIDEALVVHDVGVANPSDTYEQAKEKLNSLLCVVQDIGAYFAKQEPAQAVPVAWKHDCAALLTNNVELWIDACPHCGKPRTAPPAIDETQHRVLDFVRWIASLKTGGLIQARANELLKLLEAGNE